MIQRLLLVRKINSKADLIDRLGMTPFLANKEPRSVCPMAWGKEAKTSHYGFELKDLKPDDLEQLEAKLTLVDGVTLHAISESVESTLSRVGLRLQ